MAFFDVAICLFYGIPVSEVSNTLIYLECLVPDLWTTPRSSHYQLITGVKNTIWMWEISPLSTKISA